MVLFGQNPSQGTLFKASQFLAGESDPSLFPNECAISYRFHPNSTTRLRMQRNCQSVLRTEQKNSMNCRTISAQCPRLIRSRTGTASRLTYVAHVASSVSRPLTHLFVDKQELINFPKFKLPPHIKDALNQSSHHHGKLLPESIPNPSLLGHTTNGNGNGDKSKLRIPIEKR